MKKTPEDIIILHNCTKYHDHMLSLPEIWRVTGVIVTFHFVLFLSFYPLTARKIKVKKKWKRWSEISSSYTSVPKIMIRWCMVPEIWCATDGKTDTRKKWHKEMGASTLNISEKSSTFDIWLRLWWHHNLQSWRNGLKYTNLNISRTKHGFSMR